MKDYEKLSREHFDEMADNYAATDGRYYTPLPALACDEAAALLKGERFGAMPDRNNTNQVQRRAAPTSLLSQKSVGAELLAPQSKRFSDDVARAERRQ